MTSNTRLRLAALLAAVLFSVGYLVVLVIPGGGDVTAKDFTDYYDSDSRMRVSFVVMVVLLFAAWAIVWFFAEAKARLDDGLLTRMAASASLVGSGALVVGAAILGGPTGVQMSSNEGFVGVPIAHTFAQAGLGVMLFVGMGSLALATALVSIAEHRHAAVPRWLSIGGVIVAVGMVGSYIWLPGYIFPVWMLAFGLVGLPEEAPETSRRSRPARAAIR
jgi:hypothetical protein